MLVMNAPKARWLQVESPSRFSLLFAHDLFGKPLHTFPDHALAARNLDRTRPPGSHPSVNPAFLPDRVQNERVRLTAKDGRRGLGKNNPILPAYRYAIRRPWWRSGSSEQT
jgi:hypothetical protein